VAVTAKGRQVSKAKIACEIIDTAIANGVVEVVSSAVDDTPCAQIRGPVSESVVEHRETHAVKGGGFSKFLKMVFWDQTDEPLYGDALTAALAHAEMRALLGDHRELYARVAHLDGAVFVDAGDAAWGAYAITPEGWTYVSRHPVPFVRSRGSVPFPTPARGRPLGQLLMEILSIPAETARLLSAWAVCTYCGGPYLVLVLHGEQGSGKTTAAKVLRALTDPSAVPLRTPPRESRDLVVAANGSHVVAYDNLSSLPQWLSDALSMIATGGGYEARQLYTDIDEVLVKLKRPILLNGIENPAVSADLLDRSLVAAMRPIKETRRRSEDEIDADLEALAGEMLGALFDAVSTALANVSSTPSPSWARMVDATRWALAAADTLGTNSTRLEKTLKRNRVRRDELVLESSVFSIAVIEYAIAKVAWEGTTAELKAVLEAETKTGQANATKKEIWPQTVQKVAAVLAREAPILRRQGIEWKHTATRGGVRVKTLTYTDPHQEKSDG
jgi:hypothetical protein